MIRARGVTKRFGPRLALAPTDLDVDEGDILVVTGANGSGKTTLLRLLVGLGAPTGGTLEADLDRRHIGYVSHEPLVYRELTAPENLRLYARLYRLQDREERVSSLLDVVGLGDADATPVKAFSKGMTQRLALARALLHRPRLLVLDEPHAALDTDGAELVDREIERLRETTTFVIATHDPGRLERFATNRLELGRP